MDILFLILIIIAGLFIAIGLVVMVTVDEHFGAISAFTGMGLLVILFLLSSISSLIENNHDDLKYIHTNEGDFAIDEYSKVENGYKVILEDGTVLYLSEIILIDDPRDCPFTHEDNQKPNSPKYVHTEYGDLEITEYSKKDEGYEVILVDGTKIILNEIIFIENPEECPFHNQ